MGTAGYRSEDRVRIGLAEGARLVTGGKRPAGLEKGWYIEPTLFADVDNSSRLAQEEIFGPVVCLIPHDGEEDAIRIANDSRYGLSGAVYAETDEKAERVARRIRT
jgi:aldehyde dehydrogenase (NAD+)